MIKRVLLKRMEYTPEGTFGRLIWDGLAVPIFTVERPWKGNEPFVSCIPEGEYTCRPSEYYKGGYNAVEVCAVPGRTHILFHRANVPTDVSGCIGIGLAPALFKGVRGVSNSRGAWKIFADAGFLETPFELDVGI
jgi:hypothetical protein